MRASLKRWSLALAMGVLLGHGRPREQAQADDGGGASSPSSQQRAVGDHEVRAAVRPGLVLALRRGVELKLAKNVLGGALVLRVAKQRARSEEVGVGFVPVGPTVELLGATGDVDVSFVADQFRVRAGHVLRLAVEMRTGCAAGRTCWQLRPATHENGRCQARAVPLAGGRMQFGSLPAR